MARGMLPDPDTIERQSCRGSRRTWHDRPRTKGHRYAGGLLIRLSFYRVIFRGRGRFFRTGAGENAGQSVVALVTGVFVDSTLRRGELILAAPRLVPHGRILDSELIE